MAYFEHTAVLFWCVMSMI